jgi:hypothetical protein
MTEPTRDPRLLSAERLAGIAEYANNPLVSLVSKDFAKALLAHIAAQDQRHAALVAAAKRMKAAGYWPNEDPNTHEISVCIYHDLEAIDDLFQALAQLSPNPRTKDA